MDRTGHSRWRRWAAFGPGVACSLVPALLLAAVWERQGQYAHTAAAAWVELAVGPVKHWLSVLLGQSRPGALHAMAGDAIWVYSTCLALAFAHPVRPHAATGRVTAGAFAVWYGWAVLALSAFEY